MVLTAIKSPKCVAAIDNKILTSNVGRCIGQQKYNSAYEFIWLANTFHRHAINDLSQIVWTFWATLFWKPSWHNCVHANIFFCEQRREVFGQLQYCCLARRQSKCRLIVEIQINSTIRSNFSPYGCDVYDGATRFPKLMKRNTRAGEIMHKNASDRFLENCLWHI